MKFTAVVDFDGVNGDFTCLRNNVCFKRLEFPEAIVQVFRKSILVILRKNQELIGLPVKEANLKSRALIYSIIRRLPSVIVVKDSSLVELHNAFVNHPFAKRNVSVKIGGESRFISDNSKGNPEFEAVHPDFAVSDSVAIERDIVSLVDKGLSRDFLASALNDLVRDRAYYSENLKSHVSAIQELGKGISKFNSLLSRRGPPNFDCSSSLLSPSEFQSNLMRWF